MRIIFYFMVCILCLESKIVIRDAGVATLTRGNIGMIFYLTLCNSGSTRYHIIAKMDKCCENFTKNDIDCNLMYLIGGDMGYIYPTVRKNISLLYPNLYLHNRKGQCSIIIKYKDDNNATYEAKRSIKFDTYLYPDLEQPLLARYYSESEVAVCNTLDEDPLEDCEPVDCHMKYLGNRNFFNFKMRRCQRIPACIASPGNHTPDNIYYPASNRCRNLKIPISAKDLEGIEEPAKQYVADPCYPPILAENLRCHHGSMNNRTSFCKCKHGWISAPTEKDELEPNLFDYHMCNIEVSTWSKIHSTRVRMTVLIIAIFGATFAICIVMLSCLCHLIYTCMYGSFRRNSSPPLWGKPGSTEETERQSSSATRNSAGSSKLLSSIARTVRRGHSSLTENTKRNGTRIGKKMHGLSKSESDIQSQHSATSPSSRTHSPSLSQTQTTYTLQATTTLPLRSTPPPTSAGSHGSSSSTNIVISTMELTDYTYSSEED